MMSHWQRKSTGTSSPRPKGSARELQLCVADFCCSWLERQTGFVICSPLMIQSGHRIIQRCPRQFVLCVFSAAIAVPAWALAISVGRGNDLLRWQILAMTLGLGAGMGGTALVS